MQASSNLDILFLVHWDENVATGLKDLRGVIIYRDDQSRRLALLVLSRRMDYYERPDFLMFEEDTLSCDHEIIPPPAYIETLHS